MIHVYGVVGRPAPALAATAGLDGAPLRAVRAGGLAAVVSEHPAPGPPTPARLVEHERVLQALLPGGVVPVRYGTSAADDAAVAELVGAGAERFGRLLGLVSGRRELGIRIHLAGAEPPARTGTEYLLGRLDRRLAATRLAGEVDRALGPLAVDRRLLGTRPELRLAYLVDAGRLGRFRAAVSALRCAQPVVCTGPWPAYSFVGGERP